MTLAPEIVSKWEFNNESLNFMEKMGDDEEETFGPTMAFMAHVEDVESMDATMDDVFEAHEEDETPSYDTDAEEYDTLVNKVHTSYACDNDDLDEFIHGNIRTTSKITRVNIISEKSTSATPKSSTNSTDCNHVSTSQDHVDMLQNYATIQSQIQNYANLIKQE